MLGTYLTSTKAGRPPVKMSLFIEVSTYVFRNLTWKHICWRFREMGCITVRMRKNSLGRYSADSYLPNRKPTILLKLKQADKKIVTLILTREVVKISYLLLRTLDFTKLLLLYFQMFWNPTNVCERLRKLRSWKVVWEGKGGSSAQAGQCFLLRSQSPEGREARLRSRGSDPPSLAENAILCDWRWLLPPDRMRLARQTPPVVPTNVREGSWGT